MKEILGEIRGMRGMKESLVGIKEEIREGMREQGRVLKEELEKMKRELGEREAKWQEEKEEMVDKIKKLEEKVKGGVMREGGEEERLEREKGGESLEVKMRETENGIKGEEREKEEHYIERFGNKRGRKERSNWEDNERDRSGSRGEGYKQSGGKGGRKSFGW